MTDQTEGIDDSFPARELIKTSIEEKMRSSYLDYAMSVIVSRALPDVRDGLKPVHRRILYAMRQAGNDYNKPYKKSARIVGDVLGKFHPHSQDAVYQAIVRMAQPFSLRYLLVDGQGNFGSVDGDDAAAMRYTEIRMSRLAHEMMTDIDRETVDMMPNYDDSELEPKVLCPSFPSLLVNGSSGIAVGMATSIPPHNLSETIDACQLLLDNPATTLAQIIRKIKAPDFPTAGIIHGIGSVKEAFRTGRGRVILRARAEIEQIGRTRKPAIIVTELPYNVNKSLLIEHIANLVREKKLDGISDLRDESDRTGMRMVVEIKRGFEPEVVLNKLYKQTEMQHNFSVNMVALVDGEPRQLDLKQMLEFFIEHRREVVYRRSLYELEVARKKAHNLEGLAVAVSNIEEVIAIIKGAKSPAAARTELMARDWKCATVVNMLAKLKDPALARPQHVIGVWGLQKGKAYRLSEIQAQSILDMRLGRLTALERDKIVSDYEATVDRIVDLLDIIDSPGRVTTIIKDELAEIKKTYGDERRTEIDEVGEDIDDEDLIEKKELVVTRSRLGYIKTQPVDAYDSQKRGGVGRAATAVRDEDLVTDVQVVHSHSMMLFFTSRGRLHWKKAYQLPAFNTKSPNSKGKPIVNILKLQENETIQAALPVADLDQEDRFVVMATRNGIVKKTRLSAFANPRTNGINAIKIDDGDRLIDAGIIGKDNTVMLMTDVGKAVHFHSSKLRPIGRTARGVKGITLDKDQEVVSMALVESDEQLLLTISERGKGKCTWVSKYPVKGRATKGVVNFKRTQATGKIICCILVEKNDDILIITSAGRMIRFPVNSITPTSRATQGVKVINMSKVKLGKDESIVDVERIREQIPAAELDLDMPPAAGSQPAKPEAKAEGSAKPDKAKKPGGKAKGNDDKDLL